MRDPRRRRGQVNAGSRAACPAERGIFLPRMRLQEGVLVVGLGAILAIAVEHVLTSSRAPCSRLSPCSGGTEAGCWATGRRYRSGTRRCFVIGQRAGSAYAELVVLRVSHHEVVIPRIVLAAHGRGAEPGQPFDLCSLIAAVQIEVHLVPAADRASGSERFTCSPRRTRKSSPGPSDEGVRLSALDQNLVMNSISAQLITVLPSLIAMPKPS